LKKYNVASSLREALTQTIVSKVPELGDRVNDVEEAMEGRILPDITLEEAKAICLYTTEEMTVEESFYYQLHLALQAPKADPWYPYTLLLIEACKKLKRPSLQCFLDCG